MHNAPPLPLIHSTISSLKFEVIDDDFSIDNFPSSLQLQDFHQLDQLPLIKASSFNTVIDTDPFFHGFDFYEDGKPYDDDDRNGMGCAAMQGFHGGGFLNFDDSGKDLLMELDAASINEDPKPLSIVVADESSCVTADFHKENGVKRDKYGANDTASASAKTPKAKSGKGQWTPEEDRMLIHLVEKYGEKKWSRIAQVVKGRIGKQCRERWHNHLRPDIKKDVWTEEEDRILIEAHAEIGNKWAEMAKRLPGRTENSIKNHWNATKRRQLSRRKCRPTSLLQNYIKSLSLEKGSRSLRNTTAPHDIEMDDFSFMDDFGMDLHGLKEDFDFAMG
ncbi:transcription factor MYB98-like [Salvia miltiorrhiza]|uniref:transcription factor MYB98-like n=1 Tax=Salvia miltiorrhiza TaxID=226208 RepID=UPI0025AC5466|nr:transcription factor MYB98-like [Salvia miltiorrhiza]